MGDHWHRWPDRDVLSRRSVEFLAGRECLDLIDYGDPWPAAATGCASAAPVSGEVSGLGVSPTGEALIVVEFEVTKDCYAAVAVGTPWPTGLAECAAAEQAGR